VPAGKCSHGGAADLTSAAVPRGGISKDKRRPDNKAFHDAAVNTAISASLQLLEDIRGAAGDNAFLRWHFIHTVDMCASELAVCPGPVTNVAQFPLCLFVTMTSSSRMMGIARSAVVCFVIDTTGSMSDDIEAARKVVYDIIDSKKGTQDEPSEYILVPFNDPGKVACVPTHWAVLQYSVIFFCHEMTL